MLWYTNNNLYEKKLSNLIYNSIKNGKIVGNKFNQGGVRSLHWKPQDIDERNLKRHK